MCLSRIKGRVTVLTNHRNLKGRDRNISCVPQCSKSVWTYWSWTYLLDKGFKVTANLTTNKQQCCQYQIMNNERLLRKMVLKLPA